MFALSYSHIPLNVIILGIIYVHLFVKFLIIIMF